MQERNLPVKVSGSWAIPGISPHPSANRALPCLASKISQDWPPSRRYGCRPQEPSLTSPPLMKQQQWFQMRHSSHFVVQVSSWEQCEQVGKWGKENPPNCPSPFKKEEMSSKAPLGRFSCVSLAKTILSLQERAGKKHLVCHPLGQERWRQAELATSDQSHEY